MHESQAERTLQLRIDAREQTHALQEELLRELDGGTPNENQAAQLQKYRGDLAYYDGEIDTWSAQVEADQKAAKKSESIRRAANAARGVADVDDNGVIVYRSLGQVAIDQLLTSTNRHARAAVGSAGVSEDEVQRAAARLRSMDE